MAVSWSQPKGALIRGKDVPLDDAEYLRLARAERRYVDPFRLLLMDSEQTSQDHEGPHYFVDNPLY